jgi:hypothetical protein
LFAIVNAAESNLSVCSMLRMFLCVACVCLRVYYRIGTACIKEFKGRSKL